MRLEHPALGVFVFESPVILQSFQDSGAEAAEVVTERPSADGVEDETAFVRSRSITVAVRILDRAGSSRTEEWERLSRWLHPRDRVTLVAGIECGNQAERQITVRRAQAPRSIENPFHSDHAVSFVSTEPYWRSGVDSVDEVEPGLSGVGGRIYSRIYPRVYPGSSGAGLLVFVSAGNAPGPVVARIYGPCFGPKLQSLTTGGLLEFPNLTVPAGSFLEIDTLERTAVLNGDPGANRLGLLEFRTAVWFGVEPGVNEFRFSVVSSGAGCRAEVVRQDHFL